jgi:hypothetical protein
MKGWIDLGSDVNWVDYHGKWGKRAKDGSWYVIDFTNMVDACGSEAEDCPYVCEVKRVDLSELTDGSRHRALDCAGVDLEDVAPEHREAALVEACVSFGFMQPLDSFSGAKHAARIRANARRAAEALMRDAAKLETALERPVNAIGSTVR